GPAQASDLAIRSARSATDEDIQGFGSGILYHADHICTRHIRFDRPLMALDAEHPVLLAVRPDHVDTNRITGVSLDQRRRGILRFVDDAGLEDVAQRAALIFTQRVRLS